MAVLVFGTSELPFGRSTRSSLDMVEEFMMAYPAEEFSSVRSKMLPFA